MNKYVLIVIEQLNRMFSKSRIKQLTLSQAGENLLLSTLNKNGPLTPGQICDICHTSSAHTAKTLCQLKVKGLIKRECDLTDRRKATISLTQQGKEHIEQINEKRIEYLSSMLDRLSDEEIRQLIVIMEKLSSEVEK